MPLPPRWLRRLVLAPGVVALAVLLLTTLPLWLLILAAAAPLVPGRFRALRVLWLGTVHLTVEAVALVVMFVLWIASGFGWRVRGPRFQRIHYVLTSWLLTVLFWQGQWVLRLAINVEGASPDEIGPGRPLLVFCRHAGPGDSFILAYALFNIYAREPRIVLKDTLQWDPAIDVLLNRLPNQFISVGVDHLEHIGELATGLDRDDALVIFPEGGNFTPKRRQRAIQRLRDLGLGRMAERAERMRHVLAPRPGGVLAALEAAPDADIAWVAHTGLDRLLTIGDVWRELPMDKSIRMHWWAVRPEEVPAGREERIEWLYDWWHRIDAWIEANQPRPYARAGTAPSGTRLDKPEKLRQAPRSE